MRQLIAALVFVPTLVHAECMELRDFIKQETAGPDKYVDTLGFRHDHHTDSILMLVKTTTERGRLPKRWLFLHRDDPQTQSYCLVSRGVTFGQHQDMSENGSADNFGPPGSGLPRCATDSKDFTAQEQLRNWARATFSMWPRLTARASSSCSPMIRTGSSSKTITTSRVSTIEARTCR
jgi:hypothetical protein